MSETFSSNYVICPHCNHKHGDAWEYCTSDDPHETICDGCGKHFMQWREVDVTYYAEPISEPQPAAEGEAS